jgi:hypothetical protein
MKTSPKSLPDAFFQCNRHQHLHNSPSRIGSNRRTHAHRGRNGRRLTINVILVVSLFFTCFFSRSGAQTVSIDYSQTGTTFVPLHQNVSTIEISNGPQDDQLIGNLGMKLERTFWSPAVWAQTEGTYNFTAENPFPSVGPQGRDWGSDSPMLDNIIAQGAQPVINFNGEPSWDASGNTVADELNDLPNPLTPQYQQLVEDGLNHLRSKYPGIRYIEVWNEPDNSLTTLQYESLYSAVAAAVKNVNASYPSAPFLIGGPVVYNLYSSNVSVPEFLSYVKSNGLELDFVSWHEYGGNIWSDAQTMQGYLSAAGLSSTLPQFISEWGYTSENDTNSPTAGLLAQGAAYIAQGWSQLETLGLANIVTPFPFAENDYALYSRSMLAPYQVTTTDGLVFPLYNVYRMMSMQKGNLVGSSGLSGGTSSLSLLATKDTTGVALMLTNTAGSSVTVNMNNLPAVFQAGAFQLQEYVVDPTHSNYANNANAASLQEVVNATESASSSFSTTISMAQNSVVMLVLTPTGGATNLVQDPGFEASTSLSPYWTVNGSPASAGVDTAAADSHSGNHNGYIYDASGSQKFVDLSQTITVAANTTYTLSAWVDAYNITGGLLGARTTGGTTIASTSVGDSDPGPSTHGTDYQQYTVTFNSGSNTSVVIFAGYTTPGSASFINADDFSLLATAGSPPAAPTNLTATPGTGSVSLSWTASSGATSYNIYRGTSSGGESKLTSGVATTSYTDNSVSDGTTYYYEVTAVDSGGESGVSNQATATPTTGGGSNLVQDPGFEASNSLSPYWTIDGSPTSAGVDTSSADSHSGNNDGYIYDNSGSEKFVDLSQTITVAPNTTYTLTAWVDAYNTTGGLLGVRTTGGTTISTAAVANTDPGPETHGADYAQYTVTFNSGINTSVVVFAGYTTPGSASFVNMDDFSLTTTSNLVQNPGFEASTTLSPYWVADGSPTSAGVDTAAADSHSGNHDGFIYDDSGTEKLVDLSQTITVTANTTYTLTAWVDAYNTTGGLLGARTTGGTNIATTSVANTDPGPETHGADYAQYTVTFNSGSNTSIVIFAGYTTPGTASFMNMDDFSLVSP